MNTTTVPTPQKPWETTNKQRLSTALLIFAAILISFIVIKLTGLDGKLGFFLPYSSFQRC